MELVTLVAVVIIKKTPDRKINIPKKLNQDRLVKKTVNCKQVQCSVLVKQNLAETLLY